MTTKKERLTAEELIGESAMGSVEDDDFILASQVCRSNKVNSITKNYSYADTKFVIPEINCRTTDTIGNFNCNIHETQDNCFSVEKSNEIFKDTQEDIFITNTNKDQGRRVENFYNSSFKMDNQSEAQHIRLDINSFEENQKHNKNFYSNFETENGLKNIDLSISDWEIKNKGNLSKNDTSETLFLDDSTNFKVVLGSCAEECQTSGIILPTQPKKSTKNKNFRYSLTKPEFEGFNQKTSQNSSCLYRSNQNDEPALSFRTATLNFDLSVSCLVIMSSNTNKIMNKFILSVNELPKPVQHLENKFENLSTHCTSDRSKLSNLDQASNKLRTTTTLSDPKCSSEVNEEMFIRHLQGGKQSLDRINWTNEYLLPMKLDELIKNSLVSPIRARQKPTNRHTHTPGFYKKQDKKFSEFLSPNEDLDLPSSNTSNAKNADQNLHEFKVVKNKLSETILKTKSHKERRIPQELFIAEKISSNESEEIIEDLNTNKFIQAPHFITKAEEIKKSTKREYSKNSFVLGITNNAKRFRLGQNNSEYV